MNRKNNKNTSIIKSFRLAVRLISVCSVFLFLVYCFKGLRLDLYTSKDLICASAFLGLNLVLNFATELFFRKFKQQFSNLSLALKESAHKDNLEDLPENLEQEFTVLNRAFNVLKDIVSERNNAHKQLKQITDNIPVNFVLVNKIGEISYSSSFSNSTFATYRERLFPETSNLQGAFFNKVFDKDQNFVEDYFTSQLKLPYREILHFKGEVIELSLHPIFTNEGEFRATMVLWNVVTKQKMLEQQEKAIKMNLSRNIDDLNSGSSTIHDLADNLNLVLNQLQESFVDFTSALNTLSGSSREMTASINEISNNASHVSAQTQEAVQFCSSTLKLMTSLKDQSDEISSIVKLVSDIAEQTNLLALNATIESARAGEAGKGFAVVAKEVKDLASKTTTASKEILEKISTIQSSTQTAQESISSTTESITRINETISNIASAILQQNNLTDSMSAEMDHSLAKSSSFDSIFSRAGELVKSNLDNAEKISQVSTQLLKLSQ